MNTKQPIANLPLPTLDKEYNGPQKPQVDWGYQPRAHLSPFQVGLRPPAERSPSERGEPALNTSISCNKRHGSSRVYISYFL